VRPQHSAVAPYAALKEIRVNAVMLAFAILTLAHALIAWLAVRRLRRHYAAPHLLHDDPAAD